MYFLIWTDCTELFVHLIDAFSFFLFVTSTVSNFLPESILNDSTKTGKVMNVGNYILIKEAACEIIPTDQIYILYILSSWFFSLPYSFADLDQDTRLRNQILSKIIDLKENLTG
jgi:hypothetical protein